MSEPARRRVMIFDFDGTLTVGDGPVLAYARQAAERLRPADGTTLRAAVAQALQGLAAGRAAGPAGDPAVGPAPGLTPRSSVLDGVDLHDAVDGYDVVRRLALGLGADDALLSAAYLASRDELATPSAPVSAPAGLATTLRSLAPHARLVLATNAPDRGLDRALEVLGVAGLFDEVRTSLGKPAGLVAALDAWYPWPAEDAEDAADPADAAGDRADPASELMSVGDVWVNDLDPVHARGGSTAHLAPAGTHDPRATLHAEHLGDLLPSLTRWATAPALRKVAL